MRMTARLLLCFVGLAAFATTVCAQGPAISPSEDGYVDWLSPDRKFAFLKSPYTLDVIDKKSGKKLQRIAIAEDGVVNGSNWRVLWAPDSNRFALMTRAGHPFSRVGVYFRSGETFRGIELPDLPNADIPEKLKRGKEFPHYSALNWQEAKEWKNDGSLAVMIETTIDGDSGSITAARSILLRFDQAGRARTTKSTIKYKTDAR